MASTKKQLMTKGKDTKYLAAPSQSSSWIISLVLALQALAAPTHLLGMSLQPEDTENIGSECPMHQDAVGDSGKDDSCECSGGLCSVGSAGKNAHSGPECFESVAHNASRIHFQTSIPHAPSEHHSIYQSRAPPSISLS